MKIEVLFPEICNLYGDLFNIKYLKECLPDATIINTSLSDEPYFVKEKPDLIYMGTTTERGQILAIEALSPHVELLKKSIDEGVNFLITGNALEIFGNVIEEENKEVCKGLGIINIEAKRKARKRFNSLYLGEFKGSAEEIIKIVGFKSLFGFSYGPDTDRSLFTTLRGDGTNPEETGEGIRINNFFATYLTGPLLLLNPPFTKWFISEVLGAKNVTLAHEEAAVEAYEDRVSEFADSNTGIYY